MPKQIKLISDFEVKASDNEDVLIIEGYANTTSKDRVGDVVLQEAWEKGGLANFDANPIILAFHNHSKPIGKAISHSVTEKGLFISAEISKSATDVYFLIKEGILKTFSIGFSVKDADYDSTTDIFVIKDLELLEVSVVSVPANADSTFSVRKSIDSDEYADMKAQFEIAEKPSEKDSGTPDNTDAIVSKVSEILASFKEEISQDVKALTLDTSKNKKTKEKQMDDVKVVATGTEKLLADIAKRLESVEAAGASEKESMLKTIEDLRGEITEKSDEIVSIQKSKMEFKDRKELLDSISTTEKDEAVLLSKLLGRDIEKTGLGKRIIEKAPVSDHLGSGMNDSWEEEFSTRLFGNIRERLIVEPMFQSINMNAPTMHIPINPEAGLGQWIDNTLYKDAATSTGTAQNHAISDRTLTAYKLASKEYVGLEEEEDSLVALLPIIRDAVIRRMARSSDKAILLGTGTGTTNPSTSDPITGLAALASAGSKQLASASQPSIGASDKVTAATLQGIRRLLGVYGHSPQDIVYVVSHDAYYDLLEDPDFRTVDMVGVKATILTGQVGAVNGSPVVVSGEFNAKASTETFAVAVNKSNFIKGQLRGVMVDRDRDVELQRSVIVATRRMGFLQVIDTEGVASGEYKA